MEIHDRLDALRDEEFRLRKFVRTAWERLPAFFDPDDDSAATTRAELEVLDDQLKNNAEAQRHENENLQRNDEERDAIRAKIKAAAGPK